MFSVVWLHNPATGFRPPSATVVSVEPFLHRTGTLRCLQKEMATYRHWSVSLWWEPDDVPDCRILAPDKTEWRLISATLCGWRRCFVADQLWLMTRIREEDSVLQPRGSVRVYFYFNHLNSVIKLLKQLNLIWFDLRVEKLELVPVIAVIGCFLMYLLYWPSGGCYLIETVSAQYIPPR